MKAMNPSPFKGSRILLVEDEEPLAIGLEYNLTAEGYKVTRAADGREAIEKFAHEAFDLIILDIMLPYLDGFQVAEQIRAVSPQMPILMLTARSTADDRVHGLRSGVDDYMTKPFHLDELLLRVEGMLRRKTWYTTAVQKQPAYRLGKCAVNFDTLICRSGKQEFRLTPQEAMVLKYLIEHEGIIVSRKELLQNVWNITSEIDTRTVDNFIVRLRKYFEVNPREPQFITSIRSAGYLFQNLSGKKRGHISPQKI
jgi:two-component system, OmpR family, alkaline phosphatase synthesis response regulator PhoP